MDKDSSVYHGDFSSWSDVVSEYRIPVGSKYYAEPDEVLYAGYEAEGYEGSSDVMFRQGDVYYWVQGSHCSCYGLEGQFDPIEYVGKELFLASLSRYWRNIPGLEEKLK